AVDDDPAVVWNAVEEDALRAGIVAAVTAQRDGRWATALWPLVGEVPRAWLPLVPVELRQQYVLAWVAGQRTGYTLGAGPVLAAVPGPWDEHFSRALLRALARAGPDSFDLPLGLLADRLHPGVDDALADLGATKPRLTAVAQLRQHLSVRTSVREAFR
ncbi:DUF5691 domain-containing protein, partial [Desertihabitans aurantiacus]|uniref:DUF5691 domain-containing protein n=1 Tax=Desertihabitans aurantiacus TaxID=2282477 RepID=UPI0018E59AB9